MFLLVLTSCDNNNNKGHINHNDTNGSVLAFTFDVEVIPENPSPSSEVTFRAIATKDGKKIDGAASVKFEVWIDGEEEHNMLKATYINDGTYEVSTSFAEEGSYHLIYHINDIDGIHHMDQLDFTVGEKSEHSNHNDEHIGHGGQAHLVISNMELTPLINEKAIVKSHVAINGKALTDAYIKFEVVNKSSGETQFIIAS
jgi:hypothetical protein